MKRLVKELQQYRFANHLSQEKLARELNVSRQLISKWETGASMPSSEDLMVLSKLFNLSIDELLLEVEEEETVKKKKRILLGTLLGSIGIIILVLCITLPLCLKGGNSANNDENNSFIYSTFIEEGKPYISIDEIDAAEMKNLIIPKEINQLEVRRIKKSAIVNGDTLIEITLPFVGTSYDISEDSVETDGHFSIIFGNGNIPKNLVRVHINGESIPKKSFYDVTISEIILSETVKIIEEEAFSYTSFTQISFTNSLTQIKKQAFKGSSIQKINFTSEILLGEGVFESCKSLEEVSFSSTIAMLPRRTFYNCTKLKSVTLPNDLIDIESFCFMNCSSLTELFLPEKLEFIGQAAFCQTGLTTITLPDSILELAGDTFSGCNSLRTVNLSKNLQHIGKRCFMGCSSLTQIQFPNTLSVLEDSAFANTGLSKLELENTKLTMISPYCFSFCENLLEVEIPQNITRIEEGAFKNCSNLESLTSLDHILFIGDQAFAGTNIKEFRILNPETIFGEEILIDTPLEYLTIPVWEGPNKLFGYTAPSELREIVLLDQKELPNSAFAGYTKLSKVVLPMNLEIISHNAFYRCTALKELKLPSSIKRIEDFAFEQSGIEKLWIPNEIELLGEYSLMGLSCLEELTLPFLPKESYFQLNSNTPNLKKLTLTNEKTIPQYALSNLKYLESVALCDTIEKIEEYAFSGCIALKEITIPQNLSFIGNNAFLNCNLLPYTSYDNGIYLGNAENPYQVLVKLDDKEVKTFKMHPKTMHMVNNLFYGTTINTIYMSKHIPASEANDIIGILSYPSIYFYGSKEEWEAKGYSFSHSWLYFNTIE